MTDEQAERAAEQRFPGYDAMANRVGEQYRLVLTPRLTTRLPGSSSAELDKPSEAMVGEGDSYEEALLNLGL